MAWSALRAGLDYARSVSHVLVSGKRRVKTWKKMRRLARIGLFDLDKYP
jgi:hypothetical protein